MTKQEIIAEIKWRLKDTKQQYEFYIQKLEELPDEKGAKDTYEIMRKTATKRAENGELYAFTEAQEYMKKWEDDTNSAHYNAFLNLVRYDTLERLYNTIIDEGNNKCAKN